MRRVIIAGGWVFFSPNSWLFQFKNTLPLIMGRRGKEVSTTRDPISPCRNCCVWYLVHIWTECLGNPWWVLCIVLSRRPRAERRDQEMPKPDERGEEAGNGNPSQPNDSTQWTIQVSWGELGKLLCTECPAPDRINFVQLVTWCWWEQLLHLITSFVLGLFFFCIC